jgi:hypothetical protein
VKFTVQDPCQLVRKSLGDPVAEDLRYVVKAVVGEENFVDMTPNRSNNYCCGGGGGSLQAGYTEARRGFGKLKVEQIAATGAAYCIAPATTATRRFTTSASTSIWLPHGPSVDPHLPGHGSSGRKRASLPRSRPVGSRIVIPAYAAAPRKEET